MAPVVYGNTRLPQISEYLEKASTALEMLVPFIFRVGLPLFSIIPHLGQFTWLMLT